MYSMLVKILFFQWFKPLENQTKWPPSCFWTIGKSDKMFGMPIINIQAPMYVTSFVFHVT